MKTNFDHLNKLHKIIVGNQELSNAIIKTFYNVYNKLGYGFLEKVYENAMLIEFQKMNINCENQKQIKVYYDHLEVGKYHADLFVENAIIIELKQQKQ